jgi:hypothetical protein
VLGGALPPVLRSAETLLVGTLEVADAAGRGCPQPAATNTPARPRQASRVRAGPAERCRGARRCVLTVLAYHAARDRGTAKASTGAARGARPYRADSRARTAVRAG